MASSPVEPFGSYRLDVAAALHITLLERAVGATWYFES